MSQLEEPPENTIRYTKFKSTADEVNSRLLVINALGLTDQALVERALEVSYLARDMEVFKTKYELVEILVKYHDLPSLSKMDLIGIVEIALATDKKEGTGALIKEVREIRDLSFNKFSMPGLFYAFTVPALDLLQDGILSTEEVIQRTIDLQDALRMRTEYRPQDIMELVVISFKRNISLTKILELEKQVRNSKQISQRLFSRAKFITLKLALYSHNAKTLDELLKIQDEILHQLGEEDQRSRAYKNGHMFLSLAVKHDTTAERIAKIFKLVRVLDLFNRDLFMTFATLDLYLDLESETQPSFNSIEGRIRRIVFGNFPPPN